MRRRLATIMLATAIAICAAATGCDNAAEPNTTELSAKPVIHQGPGPLNPEYLGKFLLKTNHTAPASATLAEYPSVATWKLVMRAVWRHEDRFAGRPYIDYDAQIFGWNAAGAQVASGRTQLYFSPTQFANSGSTVVVDGVAVDFEQAGRLVELITQDIELAGAASAELNKTSCWWLAILALKDIGKFAAVSAAAVTLCGGVSGGLAALACLGALIEQWDGIGDIADSLLDYLCQCISGYRDTYPELCEGH